MVNVFHRKNIYFFHVVYAGSSNIGESINADFYKRYKRYDKLDLG